MDLGLMIETGIGGHDGHAHARQLEHVFQVDDGQRHLAVHQDQFAAFLEHHVGGAFQQIVAAALGDGRQGTAGAGADHHGARRAGAAGHRRGPLFAAEYRELSRLGFI